MLLLLSLYITCQYHSEVSGASTSSRAPSPSAAGRNEPSQAQQLPADPKPPQPVGISKASRAVCGRLFWVNSLNVKPPSRSAIATVRLVSGTLWATVVHCRFLMLRTMSRHLTHHFGPTQLLATNCCCEVTATLVCLDKVHGPFAAIPSTLWSWSLLARLDLAHVQWL